MKEKETTERIMQLLAKYPYMKDRVLEILLSNDEVIGGYPQPQVLQGQPCASIQALR